MDHRDSAVVGHRAEERRGEDGTGERRRYQPSYRQRGPSGSCSPGPIGTRTPAPSGSPAEMPDSRKVADCRIHTLREAWSAVFATEPQNMHNPLHAYSLQPGIGDTLCARLPKNGAAERERLEWMFRAVYYTVRAQYIVSCSRFVLLCWDTMCFTQSSYGADSPEDNVR